MYVCAHADRRMNVRISPTMVSTVVDSCFSSCFSLDTHRCLTPSTAPPVSPTHQKKKGTGAAPEVMGKPTSPIFMIRTLIQQHGMYRRLGSPSLQPSIWFLDLLISSLASARSRSRVCENRNRCTTGRSGRGKKRVCGGCTSEGKQSMCIHPT